MILKILALFLAALACTASPVSAQDLSSAEEALVEEVVAEIERPDEPGVAIGIVRGGRIVYERYTGLANMQDGIDIGPDTRFNIASNAKQYVASMVLDMAAKETIELDADFRAYLPGALPHIDDRVTVAQLLTHTSGVRDIYDLWSLQGIVWYENALSNRSAMALLNAQSALNFAPGSAYLYSNSNYVLLAEMIANVSGQDFVSYSDGFFRRLGMAQTGWRQRHGVVLADMARAYGKWDGWLEDPSLANLFGDGFLFTTLRDQLAWERQLQGGDTDLPARVIRQSQLRPDEELPGRYGFGLEISEFRGLREVSHIGSTGGFNAYVRRFPDQELAVVVIGNTTEIGVVALGRAITDVLLSEAYGPPPTFPTGPETTLDQPALDQMTGLYGGSGSLITIVEREGELFRQIEGRDEVRLLPLGGNLYAYESNSDLKIAFEPSADGARQFRIFYPSQDVIVAPRLQPASSDPAMLERYSGRYRNAETGVSIWVRYSNEEHFSVSIGEREGEARMVEADVLRVMGYRLHFVRHDDGTIDRVLLDGNRIRRIAFVRDAT